MTLNRHPVVEMSKILRLGLHPDESWHVGVPCLLERGVCHVLNIGVLGFFEKIGQYLECWADRVETKVICELTDLSGDYVAMRWIEAPLTNDESLPGKLVLLRFL